MVKWIAAAVVALAAGGGFLYWRLVSAPPALPPGVSAAMYRQAADEFRQRYARAPDRLDTLSWLAERAVTRQQWDVAAAAFAEIPSSHPRYGHMARLQQADCLLSLDRARDAEATLRELLRREAEDPQLSPDRLFHAEQQLRHLLEVELRFEERRDLLRRMLAQGRGDWFDIIAYCFPSALRWNGTTAAARLEAFWKRDPHDPHLNIALGRYRTGQGRLDEARTILETVHKEHPGDLQATAALLACLLEQQDWDAMRPIIAALPPPQPSDPWLLLRTRGRIHAHDGDWEAALRCFRLALQSDPVNAESHLGLAEAYGNLDQPEKRTAALRRAQLVARIQNRLGWVTEDPQDVTPLAEIAQLCQQADFREQGALIAAFALEKEPARQDLQQLLDELRTALQETAAP